MASIEPTVEEAAEIKTFGDVLVWAGFDRADLFQEGSELNSLLSHLGQRPNSNLRIIASIDPTAVNAELDEWKYRDQRPKLGIIA